MRIKSKFELNFVHIAVLAVCPLIMTLVNFNSGMTIMLLSLISFLMSSLVCLVLAKKSSKNIRIFITAFVSSLVVTAYELLVKNGVFKGIGEISYLAILSSIVLCIDLFYIDTKVSRNYFIKISRLIFVYVLVMIVYLSFKEFLSYGTIAGVRYFNYYGYEFFKLPTFDFILLGLLCALIDRISMLLVRYYNDMMMTYNKYKHKIRTEKTFIYEHYRRNNLLTSEVVINKVGEKEESDDVLSEEETEETKEKPSVSPESKIIHKPRRKNKLRVSKEAKVEQLFDRKTGNKEGKN